MRIYKDRCCYQGQTYATLYEALLAVWPRREAYK